MPTKICIYFGCGLCSYGIAVVIRNLEGDFVVARTSFHIGTLPIVEVEA